MTPWTTRPLAPSEAAIVRHPDRRSAWAPGLVISLRAPGPGHENVSERLADLTANHPILSACLRRGAWVSGSARPPMEDLRDRDAFLRTRFDLRAQPPIRVALSPDGLCLAVVSHHAALDGRALVSLAAALLGGPMPAPFQPGASAPAAFDGRRASDGRGAADGPGTAPSAAREGLRRLAQPADRVAPSVRPPITEVFAQTTVPASARVRVAPLAAASVTAVAAWNAQRGLPWRRVGLTIPVGGPPLLGNVATHRRVDLPANADVQAAVSAALSAASEPPGPGLSPTAMRLLAPVVNRLSDSLLVSNLGVVMIPGAEAIDFYPQARGRSAVAIGAGSIDGAARRLTLRARDLAQSDADHLLAAIVGVLST